MCLGKTDAFRSFCRKLDERYRTPDSYGTGNRILMSLRNVLVRRFVPVCFLHACAPVFVDFSFTLFLLTLFGVMS